MGVFQRAHDTIEAKANRALDAAEKPDEMLDLSYEKMLDQITQVKRALVDIAASRKQLELQEQQLEHSVAHLQDQARAALAQGKEDLAKEALSRKAAAQSQIDAMEPQHQQLTEQEQRLEQTLTALQQRVNDFRTRKETLKAQYTAARAVSTVDESAAGISKTFADSGAALQRAQDKIATTQARAGAVDELLQSGVLEDVGGQTDDIRACIACNQACIGHFHAGYPISCIQRPETGREIRYGRRERAGRPRRVLIAGGGPAGMKAAAVAAERGHDVVLHEAAGRLGGQVLLAERLPGRSEFGGAVTNLERELGRTTARVVLRSQVTAQLVRQEAPDLVVVATGARPYRPELEIGGGLVIADAWDVVGGRDLPPGHVVVVDWRGDWIGLGAARMLAEQGRRVTLAVNGYAPGEQLQQYVRDANLAALSQAKVTVVPLVRPYGVDDEFVYLQHVLND